MRCDPTRRTAHRARVRQLVRVPARPEGGAARAADRRVRVMAVEGDAILLEPADVGQRDHVVRVAALPRTAVGALDDEEDDVGERAGA